MKIELFSIVISIHFTKCDYYYIMKNTVHFANIIYILIFTLVYLKGFFMDYEKELTVKILQFLYNSIPMESLSSYSTVILLLGCPKSVFLFIFLHLSSLYKHET